MLDKIIRQINRKLGTSLEPTTVIGVLLVILCLTFIYWKYEQAKHRIEQERNRRNLNIANNPNLINNNNNVNVHQPSILSQSSKNELHLSPKTRYLLSNSWSNQCICICLEQLFNKQQLLFNEYQFLPQCISILKQLIKRHRVYIIHCIPISIQKQEMQSQPASAVSVSDVDYGQQTLYEKRIIDQFRIHGVLDAGLEEYKILFCTTLKGKSSMVRQLSPTLYMDSNDFVLNELHQHLTEVVQITDCVSGSSISSKIFVARSFAAYFQ